jgi:hypothetical protein
MPLLVWGLDEAYRALRRRRVPMPTVGEGPAAAHA